MNDCINVFKLRHDTLSEMRIIERKYDKDALKDINKVESINEAVEFKHGCCQFSYAGFLWNVFYHDSEGDTLVVQFNGSRPPKSGPVFKRWSWYPMVEGSVLNIDDPTYYIWSDLSLAWYYGKGDTDISVYISDIINAYASKYNKTNVLLYASSGGAIAAVRCAVHINNCKVVIINPQVILKEYSYSRRFEEITNISLADSTDTRNNAISLLGNNKTLVVSNVASKEDIVQLRCICDFYDVAEVCIGLNYISENVVVWLYNAPGGEPHNNQENLSLYKSIKFISDKMDYYTTRGLVDMYGEVCKSISEFWQDYYDIKACNDRKIQLIPISGAIDKMDCQYEITDLLIKPSDDVYNRYECSIELKPMTQYCILLECEDVNAKPHIAIKDTRTETLLIDKCMDNLDEIVSFITNRDTKDMRIRIYPAKPGTCQGVGLSIKKLCCYSKKLL